jgi:REP element-mobilizing transposase RayT
MARANRHFIPGYVWHITHRCHKREFLFKFSRDRSRWLQLLFEARKRYGLSILNYIVTSNHVHLVVTDNGKRETIPKSMQYIAGRVGQEFNQRKNRKGAFWQDRYHATAIESGDHLWQCLVYVDLNMVRAGVVDHPTQWKWGGYNEIQYPKTRYRLIDHNLLQRLLNVDNPEQFATIHKQWIDNKLTNKQTRQEQFTQSVAVGSEDFIAGVQKALGIRAKGRNMTPIPDGAYQLRDTIFEYGNSSGKIEARYLKNYDGVNQIPWSTS